MRRLGAAPVTIRGGTPDAYLKLRDTAMHKLGIGTTHDMKSVITGIFVASWRFRGYTLREKVNLWRGRTFSRSFGLWEQMIRTDLRRTAPALQIPVYFLEGKYDYTCVTSLAKDYLEQLQVPAKGFYLFENSAHSPVLEEPEASTPHPRTRRARRCRRLIGPHRRIVGPRCPRITAPMGNLPATAERRSRREMAPEATVHVATTRCRL